MRALLIDAGRCRQIDRLPLAIDDACANLPRRLALLIHGVSVIKLFQTGSALGAVRARKTAMQTFVSHAAVAVAITRLLVDDLGNLRRQFIGMGLIRKLGVVAPKLILSQDRRELAARGRRRRVKMRNALIIFGLKP